MSNKGFSTRRMFFIRSFMSRRSTKQSKIDEDAFPVRMRVLIPESGLMSLGGANDPWHWLPEHIGAANFSVTSHRAVLGDAMSIHFRCLEDAVAFRDRFPMLVLADDTMSEIYTSPNAPLGHRETEAVCNLYSQTKSQDAMRQLFADLPLLDRTGNLPMQPEIYPDYQAPIVRQGPEGRELVMARWGMPTPPQFLIGKKTDRGVTNIRNVKSPHWRRWLGQENRCLVPLTSFAEPDARRAELVNAWFRLADDRPAFFAGVWTRWTSVRKLKDGETTDELFGFLTTTPNAEVAPVHPKAMPVILTEPEEWEAWLNAPWAEAQVRQRPLQDGVLRQGSA